MYSQKTESSGVRSREQNGRVLRTLLPIRLTSRSALWKSGGTPHRLAVISCHCDPLLQKSRSHVKFLGALRVMWVIRRKFPTDDPKSKVQNLVVVATFPHDLCTPGLSTLHNYQCVGLKRQDRRICVDRTNRALKLGPCCVTSFTTCRLLHHPTPFPNFKFCRLTCSNRWKVPSSRNTIILRGGHGTVVVFKLWKDLASKCVTNSLLQQLVTCKSKTSVQYCVHCRLCHVWLSDSLSCWLSWIANENRLDFTLASVTGNLPGLSTCYKCSQSRWTSYNESVWTFFSVVRYQTSYEVSVL